MAPAGPAFSIPPACGSRKKTEFIGFAGRRARTTPAPGPPFSIFPACGSRKETDFIGFAGRRARTTPAYGPPFSIFPARGLRTKTEFIGFASRRARTSPAHGPPFSIPPARGSRMETEFIGFPGSRTQTGTSARAGFPNFPGAPQPYNEETEGARLRFLFFPIVPDCGRMPPAGRFGWPYTRHRNRCRCSPLPLRWHRS